MTLGKGLFELLPEVAAQGFENILAGVLATGQPYVGTDAPASLTRHGVREKVFVSFVHYPLREADGRISGIIAVLTDTTEQVRARQQVQRLNQELLASNQELLASNTQLQHTNVDLDNFIYTACHNLKALIANIEGLLALLRQQLPADLKQAGLIPRILRMLQEAIERFQLTIAQLTDLTRLQQLQTQPPELIGDHAGGRSPRLGALAGSQRRST